VTRLRAPAPPRRLLALALAAWAGCAAPQAEPRPNILLVTLDTLRRDRVGAFGGPPGLTPNLDALAVRGLVHEAAYTSMPSTGPAHLSLLTGLYPVEHGARRNGDPLPPEQLGRDAALRLRSAGYATAAFVTASLLGPAKTGLRGFEIYDAPRGALRPGEQAVEAALAWLEAETQRPVFLWVHLYDAHAPYGSAEEKAHQLPVDPALYGFVEPSRYDEAEERRAMSERYEQGVRAADDALGRLLAGARERLGAEPLVLVAADHGETLDERLAERGYAWDHGKYLDPECVAIPLVLAGPGVRAGRSAGAVSIRDLYTAILGAAGLPDAEAAAEGRIDPRERIVERRLVRIERRPLAREVPASARSHAAAASDGTELVIVDRDGRAASAEPAAPDLLEAARRHAALLAVAAPPPLPPEETREALRSLGYLD
jgi:arylsulfatase A-like enzyme